jgi:hypothetical protein
MRQLNSLAALLLLLLSFQVNANHTDEYIQGHKDIAQREMQRSGIPASIILAQGIHESAWGRGELAINSNNHFGIKCKDYWEGPTYFHKDDDYVNGKLIKSCFRAYEKVEDSYIDHTDFLVQTRYYQELFDYDETDYRNWAYGLKRCGYATDPAYAEKLIGLIEKYQLYEFDQLPFWATNAIQVTNTVAVMDAPTYYIPDSFSKEQNEVIRLNNFRPVNQTYNSAEYIEEETVNYSNANSASSIYEVTGSTVYDEQPVEVPLQQSSTIITEPQAKTNSYSHNSATMAIMPNATTNDRRLKNLSRRPRISVGPGPR